MNKCRWSYYDWQQFCCWNCWEKCFQQYVNSSSLWFPGSCAIFVHRIYVGREKNLLWIVLYHKPGASFSEAGASLASGTTMIGQFRTSLVMYDSMNGSFIVESLLIYLLANTAGLFWFHTILIGLVTLPSRFYWKVVALMFKENSFMNFVRCVLNTQSVLYPIYIAMALNVQYCNCSSGFRGLIQNVLIKWSVF